MTDNVSVGICAHNEEETIGLLLDAISAEQIDVDQVIVVAAGDDGTADIVADRADDHPEIKLVREDERRGQSAAQNEILDRVEEPLLFLIDGDGLLGRRRPHPALRPRARAES
ncbi:MAG: glycosyltransferase family 2 protein, partial [Candidatus Nanohaloarchaea archaeon]